MNDDPVSAGIDTDAPFDGPLDDPKEVAIKKTEPEYDEPLIIVRPFDDVEI